MNLYEEALVMHKKHQGKLEVVSRVPCENAHDLSVAYTPGVAQPCLEIEKNPENAYQYTIKGNTVAVITNGTAVLGLGDIGPDAALPVMEGKALLMKQFGGLDAWPICLDTRDPDEVVNICKALAPGFGAINLEDIGAPSCVYIERKLINELNIPVFHDDQHGTAIVLLAALINYARLKKVDPADLKIVVNGIGAAGSSIVRTLYGYGFTKINAFDRFGHLSRKNEDLCTDVQKELLNIVNPDNENFDTLADGLKGADVFIGVSKPNLVSKEMVQSMNKDCAVFAMANPEPEITYQDAVDAGAFVVGTGRSDNPNQVNNLLAFPGIFRGALDAKATKITDGMKRAASTALASLISDEELRATYVIPSVFDERVAGAVANAVKEQCLKEGVYRK